MARESFHLITYRVNLSQGSFAPILPSLFQPSFSNRCNSCSFDHAFNFSRVRGSFSDVSMPQPTRVFRHFMCACVREKERERERLTWWSRKIIFVDVFAWYQSLVTRFRYKYLGRAFRMAFCGSRLHGRTERKRSSVARSGPRCVHLRAVPEERRAESYEVRSYYPQSVS